MENNKNRNAVVCDGKGLKNTQKRRFLQKLKRNRRFFKLRRNLAVRDDGVPIRLKILLKVSQTLVLFRKILHNSNLSNKF